MEQGKIIEQYATANIVERPGAERHLYQVTKATKSPQYGSLKPLLEAFTIGIFEADNS